MGYIVHINGSKVDLSEDKEVTYTMQVNSIARLDNRQASYTNTFICPLTDNNKLLFKNVFSVGANSNFPYRKCVVDVIDADTGAFLIYKGWGTLKSTTAKGYELYVYSGIVDFYRAIENKTVTEIGIEELNHIKNVENIIYSWNNDLEYKYIVADYNGKVETTQNHLNADYLIPSAKVSYVFNRIHQYAGFTFSGNIFNLERYTNLYITFPKPIPTTEPNLIPLKSGFVNIYSNPYSYYNGYALLNGVEQGLAFFPSIETNTYYHTIPFTTSYNKIKIDTAGLFRFKVSGSASNGITTNSKVNIKVYDNLNQLVSEHEIQNNFVDLQLNINDTVVVYSTITAFVTLANPTQLDSSISFNLSYIDGYSANFDDAFIDFKATEFINEIMQHFGLTAIKSKDTNHITYYQLNEILANPNTLDWSEKYIKKTKESYIYSNYAKKNIFKYRYNNENDIYNNGYINIDNENLPDESTVINSKMYSPEKDKTSVIGKQVNVYKVWNKEIKDNGDVSYKDLSGRFYFIRFENIEISRNLKSEVLNTEENFELAPFESFYRLKLSQVIYDNYLEIGSILNSTKIINVDLQLSIFDVINFDFTKPIYINKLQSYYLVNKINNYQKNKITNVELIEVDYFTILDNQDFNGEIQILDTTLNNCELTIDVFTDFEQPIQVNVIAFQRLYNVIIGEYYNEYTAIQGEINNNQVIIDVSTLPYNFYGYKFAISYVNTTATGVISNQSELINIPNTCFENFPTSINISLVDYLGQTPSSILWFPPVNNYKINYSFTGMPTNAGYTLEVYGYSTIYSSWVLIISIEKNENEVEEQLISTYAITKLKIKINNTESNEYLL